MDFTRAELKAQAKEQMQGKLGGMILVYVVFIAVSGFAGGLGALIPFGSLIVSIILTPVLTMGWIKTNLKVTYGEDPEVGTLFESFKDNLGNTIGTVLLVGLFTCLWSLLFIIPGIIMGLAYSQALYILAENPDMAPMECIKASKEMMKGRKMDLFLLQLSFILWGLLCCITFGLAGLYVGPYMQLTVTNFYHRIKEGGDGTDVYTASEGSVMEKVENVASDFDGALNNFSDKVEDTASSIVDKIDDKINN
jgi:uncharacterized membrane protein